MHRLFPNRRLGLIPLNRTEHLVFFPSEIRSDELIPRDDSESFYMLKSVPDFHVIGIGI